ncbi:MAG: Omp28-related outer membrane protein [Chlorobi bacterium]|nr:Omp28-related outer membrane protein [Chlorobiota bacterium]
MLSKKLLPIFTVLIFFVTAYTQAQERNVLVEYCAGTWCGSCPLAAQTLDEDILPLFPNTIVLTYHGWAGSSDPFSDFEGNQIIDLLHFNSYPTGRIDRATDALPDYHWLENVEPRAAISPRVNINCDVVFDSLSREVTLNVSSIPPVDEIKDKCNLTVVLVEDSIVYPQQVIGDSALNNNYVHNNVVRKIISSVTGDELNGAEVWEAGSVISKQYSFEIDTSNNFRNCKVVAFVHIDEKELFNGEVLQAVSKKVFETPVSVNNEDESFPEGYKLEQNYPNPFPAKSEYGGNSGTTIKYSIPYANGQARSYHVSLSVYNLSGEEIRVLVNEEQTPGTYQVTFNAPSLASGIYFYSLNIHGKGNRLVFSSNKKMLFLK